MLSELLRVITVALTVCGIAFSGVYIWVNTAKGVSDLAARSKSLLNIIKVTSLMSVIAAFAACFFSGDEPIEASISKTASLYSFIACCWLVVIAVCGALMLVLFLDKKFYSKNAVGVVGRALKNAVAVCVFGAVFSWLMS